MKKTLLAMIIILIFFSVFAEPVAPENPAAKKSEFATYSQLIHVENLPDFFDTLKEFVSWKHWRYWVGLLASIFIWFVFILLNGSFQDLFSEKTQKKFVKKEGNYYLFWVGYSFIITLIFSFGYSYLSEFVADLRLIAVPRGEHWLIWVMWSGLVLLSVGAVWAFLREIVVFKLLALYSIPYQILHGITGILLVFFATTAVTYFIIAVGIVLGVILVVVAGLAILFFFLTQKPTYSSSQVSSEDPNKAINDANRRRNEEHKRWQEKQEKFNREKMKESRGW